MIWPNDIKVLLKAPLFENLTIKTLIFLGPVIRTSSNDTNAIHHDRCWMLYRQNLQISATRNNSIAINVYRGSVVLGPLKLVPFYSDPLFNLAINLSILGTAKRQDQDPVDLIKTILLKGADTPLEKLYRRENLPVNNSS